MLFGVNQANFDRESPWPEFLSADNHISQFDQFCEQGSIAEARILFSRYPIDVQNHFTSFASVDHLLDLLSASITGVFFNFIFEIIFLFLRKSCDSCRNI